MPAGLRDDLSEPFLLLGFALAGVIAAGYLQYPGLFSIDRQLALAYGSVLVAFSLAYSYRPLRESRWGAATCSLFLLLFAVVVYIQGIRGPLMPFGLFSIAIVGLGYELYRFGTRHFQGGQASQ